MDDRNRRVGIGALYVDVHEFHRVFDHPARLTPGLQPADRVAARADWLDEEVGELRDAKNIYDQADAYIDIIYFAVGGLVEMGVDPSELWRIVHGANMAKVFPDGTVKRREDGKIMKPPHWRAPDEAICEEINRQVGADATPLFDKADAPIGITVNAAAGIDIDVQRDGEDVKITATRTPTDMLRERSERARAGVAQAQGGRLLREPTKAPQGDGKPSDGRFKPDGFA